MNTYPLHSCAEFTVTALGLGKLRQPTVLSGFEPLFAYLEYPQVTSILTFVEKTKFSLIARS